MSFGHCFDKFFFLLIKYKSYFYSCIFCLDFAVKWKPTPERTQGASLRSHHYFDGAQKLVSDLPRSTLLCKSPNGTGILALLHLLWWLEWCQVGTCSDAPKFCFVFMVQPTFPLSLPLFVRWTQVKRFIRWWWETGENWWQNRNI